MARLTGVIKVLVVLCSNFQPLMASAQSGLPSDFLGVWILAADDENQCKSADWKGIGANESDRLIRTSLRELEEWEGGCKVVSVKRPSSYQYDKTISIQLACGGEGMTWRRNQIWHVRTIDRRRVLVATTVNRSNARDDLRRRTNMVDSGPSVSVYLECN
jgi:hypothetical protein